MKSAGHIIRSEDPQDHVIYEPVGSFPYPAAQQRIGLMNEPEFLFDEPSAPKCETEKEWIGPRHLTISQAAALNRLCNLARLQGQTERGGVVVRNKPLIVGPSGSGKTALVRRLCDVENLPLLVVNGGNWIPQGAAQNAGPHTLSIIQRFVDAHPAGCVMIDEIDKSAPGKNTFQASWSLGVFCEILSLGDAGGNLLTSGWKPDQVRRLSQSFFLVGAGAWTTHVASRGEGRGPKDDGYVTRIVEDAGIPDEILLRFHPKIIELTPPTAKDLALAARRIRADLSLPALSADEEMRLGEEASQTKYGMRWAEAYLSELLMQSPALQKKIPASSPPARPSIAITRTEFAQKLSGLLDQLDALRKPAKELEVKLNLTRLIAVNSTPDQRKNFLEPEELTSIIHEIQGLIRGLAFGLSTSEKDRLKRETQAQVHSGNLLRLINSWLHDKAFALKSCGALESAIHVQVALERLLDTWKFLAGVEVTD